MILSLSLSLLFLLGVMTGLCEWAIQSEVITFNTDRADVIRQVLVAFMSVMLILCMLGLMTYLTLVTLSVLFDSIFKSNNKCKEEDNDREDSSTTGDTEILDSEISWTKE